MGKFVQNQGFVIKNDRQCRAKLSLATLNCERPRNGTWQFK
jgi:hypothetical protein